MLILPSLRRLAWPVLVGTVMVAACSEQLPMETQLTRRLTPLAKLSASLQVLVVGVTPTGTPVLARYDQASGAVLGTITLPAIGHTVDVTPDRHYAFVSLQFASAVAMVDLFADAVVATIPVGNGPTQVTVRPDGLEVFISHEGDNYVAIIDVATRVVTRTIPVHGEGIAFTPDGAEVYIAGYGTGVIHVFQTSDLSSLATLSGAACRPANITMSYDGVYAFVTDDVCSQVIVLSTQTRSMIHAIPAPNAWSSTTTNGLLLVTEPGPSQVEIFEIATWNHVATIPVSAGPHEIARTPDFKTVYVTSLYGEVTSTIDVPSHTVTRTSAEFARPVGVVVLPPPPIPSNFYPYEGRCGDSADLSHTCDPRTGLEWLDLTRTFGRTYPEMLAALATPEFSEYRYATAAEVVQLFRDAGIDPPDESNFRQANFAPVRLLAEMVGVTLVCSPPRCTTNFTIAAGMTGDAAGGDTRVIGVLQRTMADGMSYLSNTSPDDREAGHWLVRKPPPGSAPVGDNVEVNPTNATTGQPAPLSIVFFHVTGAGTVNVRSGTPGGAGAPPAPGSSNFRLGTGQPVYFDIEPSETLAFDGPAKVCVNYPVNQFTRSNNLRLLHFENGAWTVLPDQTIDAATRTVCGSTTSFSPFMIAELEVTPVISSVVVPNAPVPVNTATTLRALFTDDNPNDVHTGTFSSGQASVRGTVTESNGAGTLTATVSPANPGVYTVVASVSDGDRTVTRSSALDVPSYLVVYDPLGGFTVGAGWINSPAAACQVVALCGSQAAGKAAFGFVSRYPKTGTVPVGNTAFHFKAGNFVFSTTSYEWLVVSGPKAQYKGSGTINGAGDYAFLLTATDGDAKNGGGVDRFRIKIWKKGTTIVIYDNVRGADDTTGIPQAIAGGAIKVQAK